MIALALALLLITGFYAAMVACIVHGSKQPPVPTNDSLQKLLGSKREGGGGRL